QWGTEGTGDGQFAFPSDVAVAPDGTIYVTDSNNARVQYFTADRRFLGTWGRRGDRGEGEFLFPLGVAVAPNGTVYVVDILAARVQFFTPDGTFIDQWGLLG